MREILDVDQWTSTDVRGMDWDALKTEGQTSVQGNGSHAARVIFGGHFRFREVEENQRPTIGTAWLVRGEDGRAEIWKSNYDSSD